MSCKAVVVSSRGPDGRGKGEETHPNSLDGGVRRGDHPEHHERDVRQLLLARPRARLVVQHRRIDVAKGHAAMTSSSAPTGTRYADK